MPLCTLERNVWVYDDHGEEPVLVAGFYQFGSTTANTFYYCLEICFEDPPPSGFHIAQGHEGEWTVLPRDDTIVPLGEWIVVSPGTVYCLRTLTMRV
jgi:hypothetical protein